MSISIKDQILGCLLGGALGDSIGAKFENQSASHYSIPDTLNITDDTQLTLATCEAIIERGRVEPESIARQMAIWYRKRKISGIGSSTLKALTELDAGAHWATAGATGERSAGNGAAMRISPVAFFLNPDDLSDRRTLKDVANVTHRNDEAYLGALAVTYAIRAIQCKRDLIEMLIEKLPDSNIRDRFVEIRQFQLTPESLAKRYQPTGYVVDSVPFSILAAVESVNLMETFEMIVSCGGDTDTTASMCGNLVGAEKGPRVIPMEIASRIDAYDSIFDVAEKLAQHTNLPE